MKRGEDKRSWDLDLDKHNVKMSRDENNIKKEEFKGTARKILTNCGVGVEIITF